MGLRVHRIWLGAELWLTLRETTDYFRRCMPARTDDGGLDPVRPEPDQETNEGHADRSRHHFAVVIRARRSAACRDRAADCAGDPARGGRSREGRYRHDTDR